MPHIQSETGDLNGGVLVASIYFVSGYWQTPLDNDSQELVSFIYKKKVVKPTRCTQGEKNAGPNFQATVEPLFEEIWENMKKCLEDFILHEKGA